MSNLIPVPGRDGVPKTAFVHSCGAWWTGAERSHCGGCHLTFSSLSAFEQHRRGLRCNEPSAVGLQAKRAPFGTVWSWPGISMDGLEALVRRWSA